MRSDDAGREHDRAEAHGRSSPRLRLAHALRAHGHAVVDRHAAAPGHQLGDDRERDLLGRHARRSATPSGERSRASASAGTPCAREPHHELVALGLRAHEAAEARRASRRARAPAPGRAGGGASPRRPPCRHRARARRSPPRDRRTATARARREARRRRPTPRARRRRRSRSRRARANSTSGRAMCPAPSTTSARRHRTRSRNTVITPPQHMPRSCVRLSSSSRVAAAAARAARAPPRAPAARSRRRRPCRRPRRPSVSDQLRARLPAARSRATRRRSRARRARARRARPRARGRRRRAVMRTLGGQHGRSQRQPERLRERAAHEHRHHLVAASGSIGTLVSGWHCLYAASPTASTARASAAARATSASTPVDHARLGAERAHDQRARRAARRPVARPATATDSIGKSIAPRGRSFW